MAPCAASWTLGGMNMDEASHYGIFGGFYGMLWDFMGICGILGGFYGEEFVQELFHDFFEKKQWDST